MTKVTSVMATLLAALAGASSAVAGSCQDVGGMVKCTDDVGRNATLQSLDKAMGTSAPYSPPSSYPEALKSYPSDIKSTDGWGKETRSDIYTDDRTPKATLERPGLTKGKR
jgi:hypothetical protein